MKKLVCLIFACLFLISCSSDKPKGDKILPLVSEAWQEINIDDVPNSATYVLELKHGWLVYRQRNASGGMAFVPKPKD